MRTSTLLLSTALVASLASCAWLWLQWREAQALNGELHARLAQPAERAETDPASALAAVPMEMPNGVETTSSGGANSTTAPPARATFASEDDAEFQRRLLRDPGYREAWKLQARITYSPRRENLVRLMGLSPDQADAVLDLQIEQELQQID